MIVVFAVGLKESVIEINVGVGEVARRDGVAQARNDAVLELSVHGHRRLVGFESVEPDDRSGGGGKEVVVGKSALYHFMNACGETHYAECGVGEDSAVGFHLGVRGCEHAACAVVKP